MFYLIGLPEGLTGCSTVEAASLEEVFVKFSSLSAVRDKLVIDGNRILGFAPCDG